MEKKSHLNQNEKKKKKKQRRKKNSITSVDFSLLPESSNS